MSAFQTLDWLVVGSYFLILLGIAWWVIRRKQDTSTDYFLAGRHLGWFIIGASIFASNIGSEHLVGLAGSGATDGVAMAHYELHAWCLLVLGWVMVPFFMRSKIFTMPEFLEKRVDELLAQPSGWLIYNAHGLDDEDWGPMTASFLDNLLAALVEMESVAILSTGKALASTS